MKESLDSVRFVACERWGNLVLWKVGTMIEPSETCQWVYELQHRLA